MAAFAAVNSLKHAIQHQLLSGIDYDFDSDSDPDPDADSDTDTKIPFHSHICVVSSSRDIIVIAYKELASLQGVLGKLDGRMRSSRRLMEGLDGRIRDAVYKLEDAIDSHVSDQIHSSEDKEKILICFDAVREEISCLTEEVKKMKELYITELYNPSPEEDAADADESSVDFDHGERLDIFGLSDSGLSKLLATVTEDAPIQELSPPCWNRVVSLVGMAGIGKTTLARKIFEDVSTVFDLCVWITLGPKYRYERILEDILAKIHPDMPMKGDGNFNLAKHLSTILSSKRCFFVLDDVWDSEPVKKICRLFKDSKFKILVTTRIKKIALLGGRYCFSSLELLNEEKSWRFFCEKVFGGSSCPSELEKPGRMIVEVCEGLPLMIVTIASTLSQKEKTPLFWNEVAKKKNSVFEDAYDKISNILLPSYEYSPQHVKPCFLYLGAFPLKYEIPTSRLLQLWSSEGIIESKATYLWELWERSLLLTHEGSNHAIKTCRLHSVFWHLCIKKARNVKFLHVLSSIVHGAAEGINGQRRLCIHNNILLCIKEVYTSMASNSFARSLLCTAPYHPYPPPICFSFTLLRILDALTIRFYEFHVGVFELVQLRYLALTCNAVLPASISRLRNLRYLIVGEHLSTKLRGAPSYLPKEIWGLKQLKLLQVMGGDLPDPCGAVLPNLVKLLDVSPHSCTKAVLRGTPKLKKLRIRIELAPNASESLFIFEHISHLHRLKSLKCIVVNPDFRSKVSPPVSVFPSLLKKLSLSGLQYSWEYMSIIGKLENLKVLKLQCYAFRGAVWEIHDGEFRELEHLLIEDTDLVSWTGGEEICGLGKIERIIIKHCYKLEVIPLLLNRIHNALFKIEFVDCHPSVQELLPNNLDRAVVTSSWE